MSEPGPPVVSVVVATHDRARLLGRLLGALASQDTPWPFEVVIVDDGSADATPSVLAGLAASSPVPVHPIRLDESRGPGGARNVGWRAASGEVVAFTDDDCVPAPGWLRAVASPIVDGAAQLVQGRTAPDPSQAHLVGPFSRTIDVGGEDGFYQTCNIAYHRPVLEALGGFDDRYRLSGEDTDLALRAIEAGARTAFVERALVHHDVRPSSLLAQLRHSRRWIGVVLCTREHPILRERYRSRWFWKPSHPPALAAAAGLAGAVVARQPLLGLAAVPYAVHRARTNPLRGGPRRRLAAIPGALVVDLAEVAVLAAGSVRYRTLLL